MRKIDLPLFRISHEPGGNYNFVLDEQVYEYESLDELVKAPVLGLSNPCPGSYYYAQFRFGNSVFHLLIGI